MQQKSHIRELNLVFHGLFKKPKAPMSKAQDTGMGRGTAAQV